MSLALYRRYRPGSFAEVKGQEHVTGPLRQALSSGRIHHAYLFSGPRGCGKTSSARILARSLNCEKGPTPDPCEVCDSCVALAPDGAGSLDVIELDAASHNGVDDARDLRERAFYAPVSSRFKVYIIDEAHMVTPQAFNALLKLVEEPPEFVKFIFATTEPDKVLDTIRSRTFHYPFKLLSPKDLQDHLAFICGEEGATVEPAVLSLVVRAGAGSVRDALSVLDQLLAGAGPEGVSYARAVALLGFTPDALLDQVVDAFADRDGAAVFAAVDNVVETGLDPRRFTTDLLQRVRDLIVLVAIPDAAEKKLVVGPDDALSRMAAQAARFGLAELSRAGELLNTALVEMRGTTSPRLVLELFCSKILLPAAATDDSAMLTRLDRLERRLQIADAAESAPRKPAEPAAAPPASPTVQPEAPAPPASAKASEPSTPAAPSSAVEPTPAPSAAAEPSVAEPAATWPDAAVPGSVDRAEAAAVEAAAAEAAAVHDPAPVGGMDVAAVRQAWPAVRAAVRTRRRTAEALLEGASVLEVTGTRVVIGALTPFHAEKIKETLNASAIEDALSEVLGVRWRVEAVGAAAVPRAASPAPGAPSTTPSAVNAPAPQTDTASDEPSDDDEDDPTTTLSGVALLEAELGAKVIGEVDTT
ncbi:MAG: polymerase subunit gamma/tau [Frankiaceae bacterium]|nr:polymerase subunit gamma/tau [Frankiaceae bacterium]